MANKVHTTINLRVVPFVPLKNQRGSAAVDYAIILIFVVLAVIAVIVTLQDQTDAIFNATATVVGNFGKME